MMRTKHKQGVQMASERIAVAESAISGLLSGAASRGPCGGSTSPATISFTKQYSTYYDCNLYSKQLQFLE